MLHVITVCALPLTSNVNFYLMIFINELLLKVFNFNFINVIETFYYVLFVLFSKTRQHVTSLLTIF